MRGGVAAALTPSEALTPTQRSSTIAEIVPNTQPSDSFYPFTFVSRQWPSPTSTGEHRSPALQQSNRPVRVKDSGACIERLTIVLTQDSATTKVSMFTQRLRKSPRHRERNASCSVLGGRRQPAPIRMAHADPSPLVNLHQR